MAEKRDNLYLMTDRLNVEPVIFIGMNERELKCVAIFSILAWVPLSLVISIFIGFGIIGLGVGVALAFGTAWLIGKRLSKLKRNKPSNHHMLAIRAWLEDKGVARQTMIRKKDVWDIQRTQFRQRYKRPRDGNYEK
jgi:conjugative transfer region protein (TIGR03750 family)